MDFKELRKNQTYSYMKDGVAIPVIYSYETINHFIFTDNEGNSYKLSTWGVIKLIFND